MDTLFSHPDPLGESTIQVPESAIVSYATVIAVDFTPQLNTDLSASDRT